MHLQGYNLYHEIEVPDSLTVSDVLSTVAERMRVSESRIEFAAARDLGIPGMRPPPPLSLLGFRNRGRKSGPNQQRLMERQVIPHGHTLLALHQNDVHSLKYNQKLTVRTPPESFDNRFVLFVGKCCYGLCSNPLL